MNSNSKREALSGSSGFIKSKAISTWICSVTSEALKDHNDLKDDNETK